MAASNKKPWKQTRKKGIFIIRFGIKQNLKPGAASPQTLIFYPLQGLPLYWVGGQRSGTVSWILSDGLGFHHPRKEKKKKTQSSRLACLGSTSNICVCICVVLCKLYSGWFKISSLWGRPGPLFLASTVSAMHRNAHIWNASHPLVVTYYCWVTVYPPSMKAKKTIWPPAGNQTMNTREREHVSVNYDKVTRMNSKPDESSSPPKSLSLRRVSIQKPASRISQLSRRENDVIFPDTNL